MVGMKIVLVAKLVISLRYSIWSHRVHLNLLCTLFEVTALHLRLWCCGSVLYSCCLWVEIVLSCRIHHVFFLARVNTDLKMMGIITWCCGCSSLILLHLCWLRVVLRLIEQRLLIAPWWFALILMSLHALQMRSVLALSNLGGQVSEFVCFTEQCKVIICLALNRSLLACCQNLAT